MNEQFGGDLEAVQRYVRELVNMAGNYVSFKAEEVSKIGEGIPAGVPTKIPAFTTIVPISASLPEFSTAVRDAFRASTTIPMEFIPSKEIPSEVKPNEITLISVTNLFPLRYIDQTSFLKQKFDERLSKSDPARTKLELFGEGDGTQYPPLFVPTMTEVKDQGLPFVLLGKALNVISNAGKSCNGQKRPVSGDERCGWIRQ